jgi:hypothetical protein
LRIAVAAAHAGLYHFDTPIESGRGEAARVFRVAKARPAV